MKNEQAVVEGFYQKVAEVLGTQHEYVAHRPMRRWNRQLGNGRFPDHGLVRLYGDTVVSQMRNPPLYGTYPNQEAFFAALASAVTARSVSDSPK